MEPRQSRGLDDLHASDLYLACACSQGDGRAIAYFDSFYLERALAGVLRADRSPAGADDMRQLIREHLLVPRGDAPPRICQYLGRGTLLKWLRMVATALAISQHRRDKGELPLEDEALAELSANDAGPETVYLKGRYRNEFNAAFQSALRSLSERERNLLRLYLVQQLTVDQLGRVYHVDRSTISRWISAARSKVLDETRNRLVEMLSVSRTELTSLLRLLRSQLDMSVRYLISQE